MSQPRLYNVERESLFTRLDFRTKLALMTVLVLVAFIWESPLLGSVLALAVGLGCLAAGIKIAYIRAVLILLLPFLLMLTITQGFFADDIIRSRTGQTTLTPIFSLPRSWWLIGGAAMTLEGVLYAVNIVAKTLTMTLAIPLGVFTTDVNSMIIGMVKAGVPYKIAFIFSSTLRFLPLLFDQAQSIIEAQRLRGLALESMGPLKRLTVYARIAVPLILGVLVRSQTVDCPAVQGVLRQHTSHLPARVQARPGRLRLPRAVASVPGSCCRRLYRLRHWEVRRADLE